jgi:hypothetical protein
MKSKIVKALCLALLATACAFGSFARAETPETNAPIVLAAPESAQDVDGLLCAIYLDGDQPCVVEQLSEAEQPAVEAAIGPPASTEVTVESFDAMALEMIVIAAADQVAEENAEPAYTGSIVPSLPAEQPSLVVDEEPASE